MKRIHLFLMLIVITFIACKKSNNLNNDYNFPFDITIEGTSTVLKDSDSQIEFKINSTGNIANPNNNYTISFAGANNIVLKDKNNKLLTPNTEIPFTFENPPIFHLVSQQVGTQNIEFTIKNSNGYSVSKNYSFSTIESSLNVTTSEKILTTYTNTEVSFQFTVSQDIPSPLDLKFENVNNTVTIKFNGQVISREAKINVNANVQNTLTFSYSAVADYNPKIIISDENSKFPIELSISVNPRALEFSNLVLQRRTNVSQNIYFDVTNVELFNATNVYNFNANIETPSKKLKVNIQSTRNIIKEIQFNGKIYQAGDFIEIDKISDFSKILIYFSDKDFGESTLRVKITDDWNTTSNELTTSFILYNKVQLKSNILELSDEVPNSRLKISDVANNQSLLTKAILIESLGNPITSIHSNINGSFYISKTNTTSAEYNYSQFNASENISNINKDTYEFKYIFKQNHIANGTYIIPTFTKFSNSSITVYTTYGQPTVFVLK